MTNAKAESGKLKAELAFQVKLEGRHSCLPNAASIPIGSREGAKSRRRRQPVGFIRSAAPRAILLPVPVRRLPRQGNHETDEREKGNRRVGVDGGAAIVNGCRRGAQPQRERCLALLPPMLLFACAAWPKTEAGSLYYQ